SGVRRRIAAIPSRPSLSASRAASGAPSSAPAPDRFPAGSRGSTRTPWPRALRAADSNPPAGVADQPLVVELRGDLGDAGATHAEHLSQKLLRQRKLQCLDAVARHEQPAGAALSETVQAVAGRGL